jgi:signal transduction histidine kinase
MKKKQFKLLSKALFFYLIVTLVSFIISALILQEEANKHMHNILENRFQHREHWIKHMLEKEPDKLQRSSQVQVKQVQEIPENDEPVFTDTVMTNEHTQRKNIYRKKTTYMTAGDRHYRVEMTKEADELYRFRDDVFHIVLPVFIALVVVLFLTNYLLSGYLFKPFQKILRQMANYRIGESGSIGHIRTSTYELNKLKDLYESMRKRIEGDYYKLKEYTENMSHELQTPLSIIQNKSESLLANEDLKPDQAKQVKAIYEETQQLSKLGRALNLITQIENQEFKNIQDIHTAPAVRSHVDKVAEMANIKQLRIATSLDEKQTLKMDPGLLDIMLRNLIKNSIRYAPQDTTIEVNTFDDRIEFVNEGSPTDFPEDTIFDRFKKGGAQPTLGLGLAIVKRITEVSGLQIDYHYDSGKHHFVVTRKT